MFRITCENIAECTGSKTNLFIIGAILERQYWLMFGRFGPAKSQQHLVNNLLNACPFFGDFLVQVKTNLLKDCSNI